MQVAILGGGISGLSAAYFLSRASPKYKIHLFEASSHFGGWLQSERLPSGALIEYGTRTINIRPTHTALHEIIENLKLDLIRVPKHVLASRYMFTQNQIVPIPNSPIGILKSPLTQSIPRAVIQDLMRMKNVPNASAPKSVADFFKTYFPAMDTRLVSSFVHGVYGGDIATWDARSLLPEKAVYAKQSALRSVLFDKKETEPKLNPDEKRPERCVGSFQNGVEELPRALFDYLKQQPNVSVLCETPCTKIHKKNDKIIVSTPSTEFEVDSVVSCLNANALNRCFPDMNMMDEFLAETTYSTMATTTLVFDSQLDLPVKPSLGYLVPASENIPILGVVLDSLAFTGRQKLNTTVLTAIMGGQHFKKTFPNFSNINTGKFPSRRVSTSNLTTEEKSVYDYVLQHLSHALQIKSKPSESFLAIHPNALPNYTVGYKERSSRVRDHFKELFDGRFILAGNNWGDGIGVGDVVQTSKRIVETLSEDK